MPNEIREIAQRMKVLREIAGLTEEQLAEQLGIPAKDYMLYEAGERIFPSASF